MDIEFSAFIEYFLNGNQNRHWSSYALQCAPCRVNLDYIIKMETMAADQSYILPMFNQSTSFMEEHSGNIAPGLAQDHNVPHNVQLTFKKLLPEFGELKDTQIDSLMRHFNLDMEFFGYGFDLSTLTLTCEIQTHDGVCC